MPAKPETWLQGSIKGHRRLEQILSGLTDELARRPSLLPDWTIGHLVTHLARNADANCGMAEGAQRGDIAPMYPGGMAQRESDIATGQGRPAAELLADLTAAHQRLERAWSSTTDEVWTIGLSRTFGGIRSIAFTVSMRWREVEVHLADLGLTELGSPDWDGLSSAYVDTEWIEMTAGLARRVPEGMAILLIPGDRPSRVYGTGDQLVQVRARPGRILQWLMGRGGQPDWPQLSPWS